MHAYRFFASTLSLLACLSLPTLFLSGCDAVDSGKESDAKVRTDTVYIAGKDTLRHPDSLDAEAGRDKRNTYDFTQGNLASTGNAMDLAITGRGLFILKNQDRHVYFRRPARFFQDADGYMILGNARTRLQGIRLSDDRDPYAAPDPDSLPADSLALSDLSDIRWPFNDPVPPRATTELRLAGNLDSDSSPVGSIIYTQAFLRRAGDSDLAIALMDQGGTGLGIRVGDILTISASRGGAPVTSRLTIGPATALADLTAAMTAFLAASGGADSLRDLQVTSNRPISGPRVAKALAMPALLPPGAAPWAAVTTALRAPARASDLVGGLMDAQGMGLGLESGDEISISGSIGGNPAMKAAPLTMAEGAAGTTLQDILDLIKDNFELPDRDGTVLNNLSVALNAPGSDDDIPDGSVVIRGRPEIAYAIRDVSIRAMDGNAVRPSPNFFNSNLNTTTLRDATGTSVTESAIAVHDALGKEHFAVVRFVPTAQPGRWLWEIRLAGGETGIKGDKGSLVFGQDGSLSSLAFDQNAAAWEFDPGDGSPAVRIALKFGGPGDFSGLTQFRLASTAFIAVQNGFPAGRLREISIGMDGIISGAYTNGQSRSLFQIPLADFPNPGGLALVGANSFLETGESGRPVIAAGKDNGSATLVPGAVESLTDQDHKQLGLAR